MLTGRLPFQADTMVAVIMKIVNETPPAMREFNRDVPEGVVQIVERMMRKNPDERYPDCRALQADIDRVLGGGSPAARTNLQNAPTLTAPLAGAAASGRRPFDPVT